MHRSYPTVRALPEAAYVMLLNHHMPGLHTPRWLQRICLPTNPRALTSVRQTHSDVNERLSMNAHL